MAAELPVPSDNSTMFLLMDRPREPAISGWKMARISAPESEPLHRTRATYLSAAWRRISGCYGLAGNLERAKGLEPSTPTLARSCSTTELHPHPIAPATITPATGRPMPKADLECNSQATVVRRINRSKSWPKPPNRPRTIDRGPPMRTGHGFVASSTTEGGAQRFEPLGKPAAQGSDQLVALG